MRRCAVVGGGLAGAAAAAAFARRGWRVDVYDAASRPAQAASALPAGLAAARLPSDESLLGRLTRAGVEATLRHARELLKPGQDWQETGVLTRQAGASILQPLGAWLRPAALVDAWLAQSGCEWHGGAKVTAAADMDADLVVVAAALASAELLPNCPRLTPVRGQVTWGPRDDALALGDVPMNGNGHFIPRAWVDGGQAWLTGSTYGRGDAGTAPRSADDLANLERLRDLAPAAAEQLRPAFEAGTVRAWTGVRCTSTDRRPLVGFVDERTAVLTALGSRGLTFAALAAELLAARLHGEPLPVDAQLAASLDVARGGR